MTGGERKVDAPQPDKDQSPAPSGFPPVLPQNVVHRRSRKRKAGRKPGQPNLRYAARLAIKAQAAIGTHNASAIARANGVSRKTVDNIIADTRISVLAPREIQEVKNGIIGRSLLDSALHLAEAGRPDKVERLNALQNAIAGKLLFENARLGLNESTQNVSFKGTIQLVEDERQKIADRIAALEQG